MVTVMAATARHDVRDDDGREERGCRPWPSLRTGSAPAGQFVWNGRGRLSIAPIPK
jgi:hypothetical protein